MNKIHSKNIAKPIYPNIIYFKIHYTENYLKDKILSNSPNF